jgi:hypothetical protein
MSKNEVLIEYLEEELFKLEEQWHNWPLDLSIPKQICKIKEEINFLLTNKE